MKTKLFIFIYSLTTYAVLALNNIVSAQNSETDPIQEVEKGNCDQTVEVNYRSQNLTSPDGKVTTYFEGVLRRIGKRGHEYNQGYCYPLEGRRTPVRKLMIEGNTNQNQISLEPEDWFNVMNPITFSPDNRYLIVNETIAYDGGDGEFIYIILDTKNSYKNIPFKICQNSYGGFDYEGFISDSEILFDCGNEQDEVVNLKTRSVRKVSDSFVNSAKTTKLYGRISGKMTILKRQIFPRR